MWTVEDVDLVNEIACDGSRFNSKTRQLFGKSGGLVDENH